MRYFTFNGKDSRDYFELTNEIKRPYLPPIDVPTINIPNRAGAVGLKRNEVGVRVFEIRATLLGLNHAEVRSKVRALAEFLIYEEEKELIFSDELNRKYMARFSQDSTDLEEMAYTGEGVLRFVAYDPFAYSTVENTQLTTARNANLFLDGDFTDTTNFDSWFAYNANSTKDTEINAVFTDGTKMNFLEVNSTTGLASGVNFGLQSSVGFTLTAGQTYTFSCLVGVNAYANPTMAYTYAITVGNTTVGNQRISATGDNITTMTKIGTLTSAYGSIDIYRYVKTFTANATDSNTQILVGTSTKSDMTGTTNFAQMYVADVKIETGSAYTPFRNEPTIYTNAGTAPTYPKIRVVPKADSTYIKVINQTNNKSLTYNATLPAWSILILDTKTNEAYIEATGENVIKNIALDSEFWRLEVGSNSIVAENQDPTGLDLAGQVRLYWTERYW